jgi:hypothetical protein
MKSGILIKRIFIGLSCFLSISSCCCFGARGINFDLRKATIGEGVNNVYETVEFNYSPNTSKNRGDPPHAPPSVGE